MKNLKKLSRRELSNVVGGQACTVSTQQADGSWVTKSGTCQTVSGASSPNNPTLGNMIAHILTTSTEQYCETGSGQQPITSNGGRSRCNS